MSTFTDRLAAATPAPRKRSFDAWLTELEPKDRTALETVATQWPIRALYEFIKGEGIAVSRETVAAWRRTLDAR